VASSWISFFTYPDDARSNTHQIFLLTSYRFSGLLIYGHFVVYVQIL